MQSLLEWFQSFPDLTQKEIDTNWKAWIKKHQGVNDELQNQLGYRIAISKSFMRSLGWALNYVTKEENEQEIPDEVLNQLKN